MLGEVGWVGALAAVTDRPPSLVMRQLDHLEQCDFLRWNARSTVAGERQYAFRHVLVRDVAYQHLPRRARSDRHRRAAVWLQGLPADRAEDRAELLAHHWQAAYQYAHASRQPTSDLALAARLAIRDAGDRALDLNAYASAIRWYSAALELWPSSDHDRPRLLLRLGQAQSLSEERGDAILAEAAMALESQGDLPSAAEAYRFRSLLSADRAIERKHWQ